MPIRDTSRREAGPRWGDDENTNVVSPSCRDEPSPDESGVLSPHPPAASVIRTTTDARPIVRPPLRAISSNPSFATLQTQPTMPHGRGRRYPPSRRQSALAARNSMRRASWPWVWPFARGQRRTLVARYGAGAGPSTRSLVEEPSSDRRLRRIPHVRSQDLDPPVRCRFRRRIRVRSRTGPRSTRIRPSRGPSRPSRGRLWRSRCSPSPDSSHGLVMRDAPDPGRIPEPHEESPSHPLTRPKRHPSIHSRFGRGWLVVDGDGHPFRAVRSGSPLGGTPWQWMFAGT